MTLVERLRELAAHLALDPDPKNLHHVVVDEAADELERQKVLIDALKECYHTASAYEKRWKLSVMPEGWIALCQSLRRVERMLNECK